MIDSYFFFGFSLELIGIMGLFGLLLLGIVWQAYRGARPSSRKQREQ